MSLVALCDNQLIVWVPHGRMPSLNEEWKLGDLWPDGWERDENGPFIQFSDDEELPQQIWDWVGYTFVAHNAITFDAVALEKLCEFSPEWIDTIPLCRAGGLPAGLEDATQALFGMVKDKGKNTLRIMCQAKRRGDDIIYPIGTVAAWKSLLQYNVADVLLLEKLYGEVSAFVESDVLTVDHIINQRGIKFDRVYVNKLIELWRLSRNNAAQHVAKLTGNQLNDTNIRSVPQVKRWLAGQGMYLDTLNRTELERLYADPEEYLGEIPDDVNIEKCVSVLKCRQTAVRTGAAKLEKLLQLAGSDDRIRNILIYHGAHTGRWSGRGFQPHNMAKGILDSRFSVEKIVESGLDEQVIQDNCVSVGCSLDDALTTLTRGCFVADNIFSIVDYASVEARCVAWLAGEESMLAAFGDMSKDIYCDMASMIFGKQITKKDKRERAIGKDTVLGCGYSMSAHKFDAVCKMRGIDLAAAGTSAQQCVDSYRNGYPRVKQLWKDFNTAAMQAIRREGDFVSCNLVECYYVHGHLNIVLPSGRMLTYRNARIEKRVPHYAKLLGIDMEPRDTIVYRHHHGYDGVLYGGLLTENISQAVCRDLLATSLCLLESLNMPPVLHVHDEIVCETPELEKMCETMSCRPKWAHGFPIAVEGFTNKRYSKSPFSTSRTCKALNGEIL